MNGPGRSTIYDPNNVARTTIKETNIHNNHSGNMNGPEQLTIYDPNDHTRTTIKETNIHNNYSGDLHADDHGDGQHQAGRDLELPNQHYGVR